MAKVKVVKAKKRNSQGRRACHARVSKLPMPATLISCCKHLELSVKEMLKNAIFTFQVRIVELVSLR